MNRLIFNSMISASQKAVYNAGYEAGYEAGQKSEYDIFWDNYQQYGRRMPYVRAFASVGWTNQNFKPKYDILCEGTCEYMFAYTTNLRGNFTEVLNGRKIDTSKATNLNSAFVEGRFSYLPKIDLSSAGSNVENIFRNNLLLEEIEEVVFNGAAKSTMFYNCPLLKHIKASGIIESSTVSFKDCHSLSKESIISVFNVLSNNIEGLYMTFSLESVNKAFETQKGLLDGVTSEEWLALVNTKPNWTINLV